MRACVRVCVHVCVNVCVRAWALSGREAVGVCLAQCSIQSSLEYLHSTVDVQTNSPWLHIEGTNPTSSLCLYIDDEVDPAALTLRKVPTHSHMLFNSSFVTCVPRTSIIIITIIIIIISEPN